MSNWRFEVLTDWSDIWSDTNVSRWMTLMQQSSSVHVFFHPTIVKAWVETYLPLRRLSPIFLWMTDDTGNEGILPFVLWHRNWKHAFLRVIVSLGYSDFDYHDPIFLKPLTNKSNLWQQIATFIKNNFRYDELIIDGITDSTINGTAFIWEEDDICPYLTLKSINNEQELLTFLPTSLRGDLRRQMRRMNEQGKMTFKVYKQPDEVWPTFQDFMNEHSRRWPHAYKAPKFHQNLIERGMQDGLIHFSSLNIDSTPVAWHLGFTYQNTFYYYMPAVRLSFSQYSPGKVLLYHLVNWCMEHQMTTFDHLRGAENYKTGWSNGVQHVHTLRIGGNGFARHVKSTLLRLRP